MEFSRGFFPALVGGPGTGGNYLHTIFWFCRDHRKTGNRSPPEKNRRIAKPPRMSAQENGTYDKRCYCCRDKRFFYSLVFIHSLAIDYLES